MFDELYIFYCITLSKMYGLICCRAVCTEAVGGAALSCLVGL